MAGGGGRIIGRGRTMGLLFGGNRAKMMFGMVTDCGLGLGILIGTGCGTGTKETGGDSWGMKGGGPQKPSPPPTSTPPPKPP